MNAEKLARAKSLGKCKCVQVTPPQLTITQAGGTITLTWPGCCALQQANQVTGSYADVPGATSPYTVPQPLASQKFYRLRCD